MTFTETDVCQTCGRPFRSNAYAPPPAFNPERTQMLTLPSTLTHSAHAKSSVAQQEPLQYIDPSLPPRSARFPLIVIIIAVMLLLVALAWLLVH